MALAFVTANAGAQQVATVPVSNEYVLRVWEMDDGLPGNTVSGIAQTRDGYLWVATPDGLARFDGVRFTSYLKEAEPGLESDPVGAAARNGDLWLGFDPGGVARRRGDLFEETVPLLPRTAPPVWIGSLAEEADGPVWYDWGPGRTVNRWKNGQWYEFKGGIIDGPDGQPLVRADSSGQIWSPIREPDGVSEGISFQAIDSQGGSRASLAPARNGGMWAASGKQLLRYHPGGKQEVVADLTAVGGGSAVNMLLEDRAGALWIATRGSGLVRWWEGAFVRMSTSHNEVLCLAEDREGNLWAGTHGGGLDQVRPRRFYLHKAEQGLLNDNVVSMGEDTEGRLWLAPSYYPPVRATDARNRSFASQPGWPKHPFPRVVAALCPDPEGGVWFACSNSGLQRWRDGVFTAESLWEPSTALLMDRQRNLWVATLGGGLVRHRDGDDTYISQENGLTHARALAEDAEGRVWAGTVEGLVFLRQNERFVPVPLPGAKAGESIRFLVPDGKDTVWIGALEGGLYRWHGGKVARLPHDAGLPTGDLRSLLIEPTGDFWFGTGKGLFRVPRRDLEQVIRGERRPMGVTAYGRHDGLPSTEFGLGFRNAATRTRDGRLWFSTYRGALEIVPQEIREPPMPLPLIIEEIRIGGGMVPTGNRSGFTLPPNPGPLQIQYTLPDLNLPQRLRFRYRLVGLGANEWVFAANQRTASFPHLPPGDYRFEVASAEENGPWLPATASLPFTVSAAWWETGWFRFLVGLLGALALVGVVLLVVRRRLRTRMRMLEQENALERERTRIARDIHDELGANLTQIAIASKLAKLDPSDAISTHLDEIASAARNTVDSLDEIVWAINPRNDTLSSLLEYLGKFAVNFLSASGITCRFVFSRDLPPLPLRSHVRHHLFLGVKEALNNTVKYSGAGAVRLEADLTGGRLRVVVADDGRGFEPGSEQADANGLRNMRERMAEAGGECRIESRIGAGTRVIFELPLTGG